ncbi:MAG: cob(I)yrinic acid a,c-diamide adenosyltransferase [Firmicutes bacterium]|nr:cob(I)yrinic acid a,c-diamide adenosyltransferase [Bacillota bacterium]
MTTTHNNGYVQIYTGDGKGKTTAAIGLSIRALGAGKKVLFLQFMKQPTYSEHKILADLGPELRVVSLGKPYFIARRDQIDPETVASFGEGLVVFDPGEPPADYVELIDQGLELARVAITKGTYDVVVLDELNVVLNLGLIRTDRVLNLLAQRAPTVEVVITGRGAPNELIEAADLVTEMREIKHYYQKGVPARRGIEN